MIAYKRGDRVIYVGETGVRPKGTLGTVLEVTSDTVVKVRFDGAMHSFGWKVSVNNLEPLKSWS